MTEVDWFACKNPLAVLKILRAEGRLSERKRRLSVVACCRRIWPLLTDERSRRAVQVAEQFADGAATAEDLLSAYRAAPRGWPEANLASTAATSSMSFGLDFAALGELGVAALNVAGAGGRKAVLRAQRAACQSLCRVLRDPYGPLPFRPVTIPRGQLAWNDGTPPRLAQAIYQERAFDRLPILADALEEAGCTEAAILDHLRSGGEHYRGCWVVDAVLKKE
jgi:hypothetical protein